MDFLPLNFLTDGIFILVIPILLILFFNACPLLVSRLIITYNWPVITTYKSILAIFVSPTNPKAVAIISIAFSGILINLVFLFSIITVVVIVLRSKVSSTYKYR